MGGRRIAHGPESRSSPTIRISGSRSRSWYLARIVTPEGSVKGATCPAPRVVLGQNKFIAWGFTTADTDVQDLFIETVDPSDPSKYLTPDGPKPFETREETIHVKDGAGCQTHDPHDAARSRPLRRQREPRRIAGPEKVVALAFTGLGDRDTTAEAVMRFNAARNWGEFLDAMRLYQTPTQNIVYADVTGDIGFFTPASCLCASPATASPRSTAPRAPSTGSA